MNQDVGKENLNEWNNDNTVENNNLLQATMEYVVKRPPKPAGCRMGPYLQFVTTDLENMFWIGSIVIFRHISYRRPTIEFTAEVKIAYDWEILYENLLSIRAYQINLNIKLPNGNDDENID
ncbi:unnamed protein product [Rotaria socialis]|uniref:Uncharacterized protein n=1 Tax=Rotaria socialis TaxID=392032 RepID=A0A821MQB0_9BILA|nr:unnamed protein product [Rotaria socialis]CAF3565818.1 unnamed protein product [Rotaria socialis]CAF4418001.1 unnamed protein product [Rotaria socialis]CAF4772589.1 unnamed protein product [Rotaria socialis]